MAEQLEMLVGYATPKPKSLQTVSGKSSCIKTIYTPPLEFPASTPYEIALTSLESYYSFPNIDVSNNHVRISFDDKTTWLDIRVPVGCYEITAINKTFQRCIMKETKSKKEGEYIVLAANPNTLRCELDIIKKRCYVNFDVEDSICTVLGFDKKEYGPGQRHEGEHIVNIMNVNSILVHCDIIESSRLNGVEAPIIYTFFPNASPGDKIVSVPRHLIYVPITLNVISCMTCWVTDQNGRDLNLQGEELTLTFHIKAC